VNRLRRHWPIVVVLCAGAALRLIVMLAYTPFFWFTDTVRYLRYAELARPDGVRPWGYSGFLWLTLKVLSEQAVVALQHVLVLVLAAALYALLVRRGVGRILAALAVAPMCLSPLVVNIEHHLLSDWLFVLLFTAAAVLLVWSDGRPPAWGCALAGLAVAGAIVTRQVGLLLFLPLLAYLLVRRAGPLRIAAFVVPAAVPVLAYLAWVHSTYGVYSFSTWSGKMLYARVAPIARCERLGHLTLEQQTLCDAREPERRPGPGFYLWTGGTGPARHLPDRVTLAFARQVITHQPVDYARTVVKQSAEMFYPGRDQRDGEACVAYWEYPGPQPGGCRTDRVGTKIWRQHPFEAHKPLAGGLSTYQQLDAVAGPSFLACVLAVLAGLVRRGARRLRVDALLFAVLGLAVTVGAFATAEFSYRYTFPLYATVPVAAALALTPLLRRQEAKTA
jgi:4-amino-4-deoxy-L-arabinose transferase-like glycosyltransferase